MHTKTIGHWALVLLVGFSNVVPYAGQAAERNGSEDLPFSFKINDVSLSADGSLRGMLSDSAGRPRADTKVSVLRGGEVLVTATSESDGQFEIRDLRPGLYEINTARSCGLYRIWQDKSAPPSARNAALIVERDRVIRAQEWSVWHRTLILGGVIITSGVLGGVIGYNLKDDAS